MNFSHTINTCHSTHVHERRTDVSFHLSSMEVLVFIVMILYSLCSICFPTAVHTCSGCSNLSSWFIVDKHVKFRLWLIQEKKRKRITIFYFCLFFSFINQRLTTGELKSWDPDICTIWLFVHDNEMVFMTDLISLK